MEKERRNGCFSEEEVDLLKLQFTDLFGQLKMVEMTGGQAEKAIKEGYAINRYALGGLRCEGAAPDSETLKDRAGNMELYLKPDMTTYQILPWDSGQENVAGVICDVMDPDGNPSWADTRGLLKETVSRLEKLGLQIYFDFQCEFYLFHSDDEGRPTTITHEVAGYYDAGPIDLAESVRRDIMLSLAEAGMEAESSHHGLTPGQHGFLIPARCGTEAADYLQTFKTAVKRIAKRHGLHATFLPKPDRDSDGSGLHVGITLRDKEGRTAREAAGYFRAGILKHLWDMMIFTNPLINSYKRLAAGKRGIFQPEFPAAAWEDRTDKVVRFSEDKEGNCRITALYPDPAANPYLALAAITAAGIDGIVQKLQTEARDGKTEFPETLGVVLRELDNNTFAKSSFGEKLCRMYKDGKQEEWDRFCSHVTDWEMKEYLYRC